MSTKFKINMRQFKEKWNVYSDNVKQYDIIINNKGIFITDYPDQYENWLLEFNIFYTKT